MEALKTRQYTVKNSPISESAKRFDRPIPWYALEALKAMGRMDGDMIDSAGEARTIEGWRQECERLRGLGDLVVKLQAERQGWLDRIKANDATYDALNREHTKLTAERERLKAQVDELEGRHIALISEYNDRVFERDKFRDECERLKAEESKGVVGLHAENEQYQAECELLRDKVVQLETQLGAKPADDFDHGIEGENETLRIIIRHLADLI